MRRTGFILLIVLVMVFSAGCQKTDRIEDRDKEIQNGKEETVIPEFSSEYLIGIDYGGSGWGEYFDCLGAEVIISTDHSVQVYMPTKVENHSVIERGLIATLSLSDEQYEKIEKAVDREKLFTLDPEPDQSVLDGYSRYLMLYDTDQQLLKRCGGYMPQSKVFNQMYGAVNANLPEEIAAIREEQIEKLREWSNQP
ncbi:MAG: hypothetical protein IKG51_06315 [Firmicutes bacterium]|nr:hypothetical protein [Bacillota bacterium]